MENRISEDVINIEYLWGRLQTHTKDIQQKFAQLEQYKELEKLIQKGASVEHIKLIYSIDPSMENFIADGVNWIIDKFLAMIATIKKFFSRLFGMEQRREQELEKMQERLRKLRLKYPHENKTYFEQMKIPSETIPTPREIKKYNQLSKECYISMEKLIAIFYGNDISKVLERLNENPIYDTTTPLPNAVQDFLDFKFSEKDKNQSFKALGWYDMEIATNRDLTMSSWRTSDALYLLKRLNKVAMTQETMVKRMKAGALEITDEDITKYVNAAIRLQNVMTVIVPKATQVRADFKKILEARTTAIDEYSKLYRRTTNGEGSMEEANILAQYAEIERIMQNDISSEYLKTTSHIDPSMENVIMDSIYWMVDKFIKVIQAFVKMLSRLFGFEKRRAAKEQALKKKLEDLLAKYPNEHHTYFEQMKIPSETTPSPKELQEFQVLAKAADDVIKEAIDGLFGSIPNMLSTIESTKWLQPNAPYPQEITDLLNYKISKKVSGQTMLELGWTEEEISKNDNNINSINIARGTIYLMDALIKNALEQKALMKQIKASKKEYSQNDIYAIVTAGTRLHTMSLWLLPKLTELGQLRTTFYNMRIQAIEEYAKLKNDGSA